MYFARILKSNCSHSSHSKLFFIWHFRVGLKLFSQSSHLKKGFFCSMSLRVFFHFTFVPKSFFAYFTFKRLFSTGWPLPVRTNKSDYSSSISDIIRQLFLQKMLVDVLTKKRKNKYSTFPPLFWTTASIRRGAAAQIARISSGVISAHSFFQISG